MLVIHIATMAALIFLIEIQVCLIYVGMCLSGNDEGAMYGVSDDPDNSGICNYFIEKFQTEWGDQNLTAFGIYVYNMIIMLPVIVFFLLDQPHDCFTCLGKDPDHIYSTY